MRHLPALLFAIALLAAGCAKPEAQLIGKWQVDTASLSTGDSKNDAMAKAMAPSMTMEFKADKTFSGPMMGGTYELSDHTVTLKMTTVMGMDMSKLPNATTNKSSETATLSDDGKTLTIAGGNQPIKFVKA